MTDETADGQGRRAHDLYDDDVVEESRTVRPYALTRGAARQFDAGEVRQSIVEMDRMFLFTTSISDGSVLAVAAEATCDVGLVGYEMTLLVTRAEATMTPQLVSEMRSHLSVGGVPRPVGAEG